MIYAILITGILIVIGILFPFVSLPIWGLALCVLAWCLKDVIPYLGHYDSDSVERYFKTQEDAMIYTRALLHQGYLHREEIRRLNKTINSKK